MKIKHRARDYDWKWWNKLIELFFTELEKEEFTEIPFIHIKDKRWGLSIDLAPCSDKMFEHICNIEMLSMCTCSICWKHWELRDLPWMDTLCFKHFVIKKIKNFCKRTYYKVKYLIN